MPYVSPCIGDDMLALWRSYQFECEEDSYTATEVRFLDSTTVTIAGVFFYFRNSEEYPDLDQAAEIVRKVASRVLPAKDGDSASQGMRVAAERPERLGLGQITYRRKVDMIRTMQNYGASSRLMDARKVVIPLHCRRWSVAGPSS